MAYDGSDFVGLHDECVGDGVFDTQSLDVWLSQRINGNARRLTSGVDGATCAFWQEGQNLDESPSVNTGDRPWASVDWSMPVFIPLLLQPGMTAVEVCCLWMAYQFGTGSFVDIEWRILNGSYRVISSSGIIPITTALIWDDQAGDDEGQTRFTLPISGGWSGVAEKGSLVLRLRSRIGSDTGTNYTLGFGDGAGRSYLANASRNLRPASNGPVSGDIDIIALQKSNGGSGLLLDILGLLPVDSPGADGLYVTPDPQFLSSVTYDAHHLSYIQCRAMQIRHMYDPDSLSNVDDGELKARQNIESDVMARIAQQPTSYHKRGRLLAWGPPGYIRSREEIWPAKYHTRFSRAYGSDATAALVDAAITLPFVDGRIEVTLDCIASFFESRIIGTTGSSGWTLTLELIAFDTADTSWASPTIAATQSANYLYDTFPTAPTNSHPHLVAEYYWREGYAPREGLLFDPDLIISRRQTIGVDFAGADLDLPYRLRLKAVADMSTLESFPNFPDATLTTPQRLGLVCTGWSATGYGK